MRLAVRTLAVMIACGCGTDGTPAIFPSNYAKTYQEVRDCRRSLEHSANIRILVSPDAVDAYGRTAPFPTGSFVIKEEYASDDITCSKAIEFYTVMRKLEVGSAVDRLDWEWQKADSDKLEMRDEELDSCVNCHAVCGKAPMGYDGTCSEPF